MFKLPVNVGNLGIPKNLSLRNVSRTYVVKFAKYEYLEI